MTAPVLFRVFSRTPEVIFRLALTWAAGWTIYGTLSGHSPPPKIFVGGCLSILWSMADFYISWTEYKKGDTPS